MMNTAIIGYGYWGKKFLRLIQSNKSLYLHTICDLDQIKLNSIDESIEVFTTTNYLDVVNDNSIDVVIIATTVSSHFQICKKAIEKGKNVLCEKPITQTVKECEDLYHLAKENNVVLMTGHTFLHNESVKFVKSHIQSDKFGSSLYFNFVRTGLGPVRQDVNAMWDLAPHDISMLLYWIEKLPISVSAFGKSFFENKKEDVVFIIFEFENNIIAKIHLSWLDPIKTRQCTIVGENQMITFNDVEINEKVRIFDKGISYQNSNPDYGEFQLSVRDGGIYTPNIKNKEPLREELNDFIDTVQSKNLDSDYELTRNVIRVLVAAHKSLNNEGAKVFIQ